MHAIAKLRRELGLSQEAFGASLGVTAGAVCQWETGRTVPGPSRVRRIYRLYSRQIARLELRTLDFFEAEGVPPAA